MSQFDFGRVGKPCLMGIVNVTPNSFSDGGEFFDSGAAIAGGRELAAAGARILDLARRRLRFFATA